jgi:hypothetical protein
MTGAPLMSTVPESDKKFGVDATGSEVLALDPQPLIAVTEILPDPKPAVTCTVVDDPATDHPLGAVQL